MTLLNLRLNNYMYMYVKIPSWVSDQPCYHSQKSSGQLEAPPHYGSPEDVCRLPELPLHELWGQVFGVSLSGLPQPLVEGDAEPEVPQLAGAVLAQEDVGWLDVKVAEPVVMEVLETLGGGMEGGLSIFLR